MPLEINQTKIRHNIVNTVQGPQEVYEIVVEFKFSYRSKYVNKTFESGDILVYDYDTGILVSWPVINISPEILAMGIEDVDFAEKYMSEINIGIDIGDPAYPWAIILLKNLYIIILLATIVLISAIILGRKRKKY